MQSDRHARTGADAAAGDPLTGRLLDGRYRIGPRIARGGMASVYEATDLRLDRTVAVKVMHPGLGDDDEFAARFVREARAAARLSHPNVVAVYDQGDDDGTVFLAMELVPGHTLRDVIRKESPMPPARALALLEPVLSALAARPPGRADPPRRQARERADRHRPRPGASRVKVADFGLAKAVSADTQHTATGGVLIGTVSYLAPELVVDGRADARADVYAAGRRALRAAHRRQAARGRVADPGRLQARPRGRARRRPRSVPGLPAYVDALVARATARDRGQRPADAGVLLHQLHRVARRSPTASPTTPSSPPTWRRSAPPRHRRAGTAGRGPDDRADTAPDPFDAEALAALMAPPPCPSRAPTTATTAIDRPRARRSRPRPAAPRRARRRPRRPRAPAAARCSSCSPCCSPSGAGVGAWWFGWARYTADPRRARAHAAAAVEQVEAAGLDAEVGDQAYSETVPAGPGHRRPTRRRLAVLDGGTVDVDAVARQGALRRARSSRADRGPGPGRAAAAPTWPSAERSRSTPRPCPRAPSCGSDPKAGTTLRPGAAVDLVVSRGRGRSRCATGPARTPTGRGTARAPGASRSTAGRGVLRHRRRGRRHLPVARRAAPLFRGDTVCSWSRGAPSWSRSRAG